MEMMMISSRSSMARTGNILLSKFFDFVDDDRAEAIDVAPDGSFVVTGRSDANASVLLNWNYTTVKYDNLGNQVWTYSYNGAGDGDDWPVSVALFSNGNVAVTGFSDSNASPNVISNNFLTQLYDSQGLLVWSFDLDNAQENDEGSEVIFNDLGLVRTVGYVEDNEVSRNAAVVYFDLNGSSTVVTENGTGDNTENVRDMVVGTDNSVYLCGYSVAKDTDRNMCTIKLSSTGDTLWTRTLSGTMYGSDEEANSIKLDNAGNVIVSGYTKNSGTGSVLH